MAAIAAFVFSSGVGRADEGGVPFWLSGQFGSLAAVPGTPGWSLGAIYYHADLSASGNVAAAKEIQIGRFSPNVNVNLNLALHGTGDLFALAPTYTFATPVFGGQLAIGMTGIYGRNAASLAGNLTLAVGSLVVSRTGTLDESLTAFGDLYPLATLKWNQGVNNFMTYVEGDIPVGAYDPTRLANVGIGHGAIDAGGGYTYLNPATGNEFSGVAGFTYNFKNPDTQYQNGIDFHFDWGASHFLTKEVFIGLVGYAYQQLTADSGQNPQLGPFKSRIMGVGPQLGIIFPMGGMQGFFGAKAYGEFDAANRASGWNAWLTFAISEAAPPTVTPTKHQITK